MDSLPSADDSLERLGATDAFRAELDRLTRFRPGRRRATNFAALLGTAAAAHEQLMTQFDWFEEYQLYGGEIPTNIAALLDKVAPAYEQLKGQLDWLEEYEPAGGEIPADIGAPVDTLLDICAVLKEWRP